MSELSGLAITEQVSRGRRFDEPPHRYRGPFERDRDRIIHSEAFRRLEGKTQVFGPGVNDHYRTRMTHTIEVCQIGRTIARALRVSETLTEAICLAHDIGHSPFGHDGEKALDEVMKPYGGFEHNAQALRIVDEIENPYPERPGLNLMYETRLGLAKHHSVYDNSKAGGFEPVNCSLEGQIADIADRIAYNCHDMEDGLRAKMISEQQLEKFGLYVEACERVGAKTIENSFVRRTRVAKGVIDLLVTDCIETSCGRIESAQVKTPEQVMQYDDYLIVLSASAGEALGEIERFLFDNFYRSEELLKFKGQVRSWVKNLFDKLCDEPEMMPLYYQRLMEKWSPQRAVCDYIAGMTDRYCMQMLEKTGAM